MGRNDAESREDVMLAPSLTQLLQDRTAEEFRGRWEKRHPPPRLSLIGGSFLVALVFQFLGPDFKLASTVFFILCGIQVFWAVVITAIRLSADTAAKQEQIQMGHYPPESSGLVLARIRWWNHLIVPKHWARHSRIHDRKYKLEIQMQELAKKIAELTAEEEDSQETLDSLQDDNVATLAAKINTWAQRVEHETRIASIEEELPRLQEEYAFYKALHHKICQVTNKLTDIEKLSLVIEKSSQTDLNEVVIQALSILEHRRQLVQQVDRIDPAEFLEIVSVH